jgi:hypothetical protein
MRSGSTNRLRTGKAESVGGRRPPSQPVIDTAAKYGVVPVSTSAADMISKEILG